MRVFMYATYITKTGISHPYQNVFLWALLEEEECYNRLPFFSPLVCVTYLTDWALCFVT